MAGPATQGLRPRPATRAPDGCDGCRHGVRARPVARRGEATAGGIAPTRDVPSRLIAPADGPRRFASVEIRDEQGRVDPRHPPEHRRAAPGSSPLVAASLRAHRVPPMRLDGRGVHVLRAAQAVASGSRPAAASRHADIAELPGHLETFDE